MEYLYIVKVRVNDTIYEYEYGNIEHAREHYDSEITAELLQYKGNGEYVSLFSK